MSAQIREREVVEGAVGISNMSSIQSNMEPGAEDERSEERKKKRGHAKTSSISEKDRKIGHRRINEEGQVSYKKIQTNQLMGSIQLGIQCGVGSLAKYPERDLLMHDFMTIESAQFLKPGSQQTPAHTYSDFTFRTYAPVAFRYFRDLFGIPRDDFLVSICDLPMRELSNPGASGSIFYLTDDDEFILKTVMLKEAEFLQKLLPGYYMNLNQNPHTLLPKFFGMFCYQCNQKNIRLIVMNNLLPTSIQMHLKFDLKGSTYKRKASRHERSKRSPTYKDLDFMEMLPDGILLEPDTYTALISTMRRDCRVLESFKIMDYSLLLGIHNMDQSAKEKAEMESGGDDHPHLESQRSVKQKLVAHSTAMESIQATSDPVDAPQELTGGIPARNHKGERLMLFIGIIDILQSYRLKKKLEHTFKAMIHDGDTVSVHRPGFYAERFMKFMSEQVFKKTPSSMKHSPSKRTKRESVKNKLSMVPGISDIKADSTEGDGRSHPDVVPAREVGKGWNSPRSRSRGRSETSENEVVSVSDIRLEPRYEEPGGGGHLSTAASTGRTPTPSWTEGTPSYTESTYSGDAGGSPAIRSVGGATPIRSLTASKDSMPDRIVEERETSATQHRHDYTTTTTTTYHETEMPTDTEYCLEKVALQLKKVDHDSEPLNELLDEP